MPVLREQDFDKLATQVVDQFLSGEHKLASAAAKAAMDNEMNPDQIERLVQAANTMTFLRMMDQRKQAGAGDLMHEFDPIDSRQVIRIVIDETGVHVEPEHGGGMGGPGGAGAPMGMEHELPDEMGAMRMPPPPGGMNPAEGMPGHTDSPEVEQCEEQCHDELDPPGVETEKKAPPFGAKAEKKAPPFGAKADKKKGPPKAEGKDDGDEEEADKPPKKESPKEAMLRQNRMRKLSGILADQVKQAEWEFEDTYGKLVSRFKLVYNATSYEAFEKDAMAEHGDLTGVSILNLIRSERGLPALDVESTMQKVASEADHHVSIDTPELHLFEMLVKIANEAAKIEKGLAWVKAQCA